MIIPIVEKKLRDQKKRIALKLLVDGHSNDIVNEQLKKQFHSGLSNRDLKKLRNTIVKPHESMVYIGAFQECYPHLANKEIREKFRQLYFDLIKSDILKSIPNSIRVADGFLSGLDDIQAIAEGKIRN